MAMKRPAKEDGKTDGPSKKTHWNLGLKDSMKDPNLQIYTDEKIVIIKDKYPKAKFHYLVLPHESIPNLKALKKSHLDLLKHMQEKGIMISEREANGVEFRYGYHAVPSMSHVHLHVISQDFNSACLKTKKHWNSFTSSYFVNSEGRCDSKRMYKEISGQPKMLLVGHKSPAHLIKSLEETGSATVMASEEAKKCLDLPLRCHKCKAVQPTMPKLKAHLLTHLKS